MWLMLCGVIFQGNEITFDVSLLIRLGLNLQMQDDHYVANGLCKLWSPRTTRFYGFAGVLDQAIAICYHISLVVNLCSDTPIKIVACDYISKLSLNSLTSHAVLCHIAWWVHFAVCFFGPLNALLHVYLCYTACFSCVICTIYLLPVHISLPSFILHHAIVHWMLESSFNFNLIE